MAPVKSIKLFLTIFIATTCMYMVLYQYHITRQPMPHIEIIKQHKDKSNEIENTNGIGGSYTSYSFNSNNISSTLKSASALTSSLSSSASETSNLSSVNAVELQALNKTSTKPSTSLSTLSLFSLPSHTTKLFKKMNLFLWSPMALLSSSSSSTSSKQAISKKSSLALLRHQKQQYNLSSLPLPSNSSSILDLNNTLITSSTSSSTTTTTKTTTSTKTSITSETVASTFYSSSNRVTTIKPSTELPQKTKQTNSSNSEKLSSQLEQQLQQTNKPPIFIITPTYRRAEQLAELTRLGNTLKHVVNLQWLVIEDANKTSDNVIKVLNRIGVPYEYFLAPMPEEYKKKKGSKPRGVSNRNRGLKWVRENATEGVVYFADDDNTYDISIFEQMRYTKKVSMWPVGLVTKFGLSSPIVKDGKLTGFYDGWIGGRKYPVDMAGFAVSVKFLHERPKAQMPFKPGYEEDGFLKSLAPLDNSEIELLANNCTEILTWHTQTKKNGAAKLVDTTKYGDTNLILLDKMQIRI